MSSAGPSPIPRGWYPDPSGTEAWRWWDGAAWTEFTSPPTPPTPAAALTSVLVGHAGMSAVHQRLASEKKSMPWSRAAFAAFVVVAFAQMLTAWSDAHWIRQTVDIVRATPSGVQPSLPAQPGSALLASQLTLLALAGFYIAVCIWQFHAAKTAQLLGIPARRSPGLGVGAWFIPFVNWWFPYQALRDCLPPGHPGRPVVGRLWACYLGALGATFVTEILAFAGDPAGFAFAAVALCLAGGFAYFGARTVGLIARSHEQVLANASGSVPPL